MELHTFSSLNKDFLSQYKGSMNDADIPVVYFNPDTIAHKKLAALSVEDVKKAFANDDLLVFTDTEKLRRFLVLQKWTAMNLLLMSSGNFGGLDYRTLSEEVLAL